MRSPIVELTTLSTILGNHNSHVGDFLDRVLIHEFFDSLHPKLFSKGGLYRAIRGYVPRPEYYDAELPAHEHRSETLVSPMTESLRQMLGRHGALYLKNTTSTVGGGHGLVKMTADAEKVQLRIPRSGTRDYIKHALDRLFWDKPEDFIRFSTYSHQEPDIVDIPIMKTRANQPLEKILYALLKHAFEPGEYVIEAPTQIPLYNGRTWEVRNIVQCPNGKPQISARYAKVGSGKDFSNIALGGEPENPETVIAGVYQTHTQTAPRTAQKLAKEYLRVNDGIVLDAANALNRYMFELAARHVDGIDSRIFYAREFSVDITGEFNGTQKLRPVVNELQYPMGHMTYIPELSITNPRNLDIIYEIKRVMKEQDAVLLNQVLTK